MRQDFKKFLDKAQFLDKSLIILLILFPLSLCLSIFFADLFASLSAIIIIIIFLRKKDKEIFLNIKFEFCYFLFFYLIIIISLVFSDSFKNSFLPSFFYFRYILFAVSIYYILNKYEISQKFILSSLLIIIFLICIDGIIQYFLGVNSIGYKISNEETRYIRGFFNDEKKLGSYLVRIMPIILSLFYFYNLKKISIFFILFVGFVIFLTSERVALFLFFVISSFYFLIVKEKFIFLILIICTFAIIFSSNNSLRVKYLDYTFKQIGVIETKWNKYYSKKNRYYSKEHEDLFLTAFIISKDNLINGIGIKNFYNVCNSYKKFEKKNNLNYLGFLKRENLLTCSTHPHNTYVQILSEIGFFGFIFVLFSFFYILVINLKILVKKKKNNLIVGYYLLNTGILINLFPFIPAGNFFNNWLSLIFFYLIGFWLHIKQCKNNNF